MFRALLPAAMLAVVMSAIYILPPFQQVESAMDMDIDSFIGAWETKTYPPSELELAILAGDTLFSKARCFSRRLEETSIIDGTPVDVIDLSIVLSGHDLANSIHRPERCMPAQGHRSIRSSQSEIELPSGRAVPVTRLLSRQEFGYGPPEDRKFASRECLTYYFFVGHDSVTRSHTIRTLIDIKDRVARGEAQRWAYVSATVPFVSGEREYGAPLLGFEAADQKIRRFLAELAESNIDWQQVTR